MTGRQAGGQCQRRNNSDRGTNRGIKSGVKDPDSMVTTESACTLMLSGVAVKYV